MYNIVNYAKKLQISDIFMQFTNLKDTIFLENVNTFLDTNYFFEIQKYDPTKSITNLNGNIISLKDKLTSNIEEYIIVDNDPDNFKLIQTSTCLLGGFTSSADEDIIPWGVPFICVPQYESSSFFLRVHCSPLARFAQHRSKKGTAFLTRFLRVKSSLTNSRRL